MAQPARPARPGFITTTAFLFCKKCKYQLENGGAKCRACGALSASGKDNGDPGLPWYGLYLDEWERLSNVDQHIHMWDCEERIPHGAGEFWYDPARVIGSSSQPTSQSPVSARESVVLGSSTIRGAPVDTSGIQQGPSLSQSAAETSSSSRPAMAHTSASTTASGPRPTMAHTSVSTTASGPRPAMAHTSVPSSIRPPQPVVAQPMPARASVEKGMGPEYFDRANVIARKSRQTYVNAYTPTPPQSETSFPSLPKASEEEEKPTPAALLINARKVVHPTLPTEPEAIELYDYNRIGEVRTKIFNGAVCHCGGAHPFELHEDHSKFLELLIPLMASRYLKPAEYCTLCGVGAVGRTKHTTDLHDRMGWFDHPRNPPLPPGHLEAFVRPPQAEVSTVYEPLPQYYYFPKLFKCPDSCHWPEQPKGFEGFRAGWFNPKSQKRGHIEERIEEARRIEEERRAKESRKHRPLFGQRLVEQKGREAAHKLSIAQRKAEVVARQAQKKAEDEGKGKSTQATEKPVQAEQTKKKSVVAEKSKEKPVEAEKPKEKSAPAAALCFCTVKGRHGSIVTCPRISPEREGWFDPKFVAAMRRFIAKNDINLLTKYVDAWNAAKELVKKPGFEDDQLVYRLMDEAFGIYQPYLAFIRTEEDLKTEAKDFGPELSQYRIARSKTVEMKPNSVIAEVNSKLKVEATKTAYSQENLSDLSTDVGFEPIPEKQRGFKLPIDWAEEAANPHDAVKRNSFKLGSAPDGYLDGAVFHAQKIDGTNRDAFAHAQLLKAYVTERLLSDQVEAYMGWYDQEADVFFDEVSLHVKRHAEEKLWNAELTKLKSTLKAACIDFITEYKDACSEVFAGDITFNRIETLREDLQSNLKGFLTRQKMARLRLFTREVKGLGWMIVNACEKESVTHWHYIQGTILPGYSPEPAYLQRLVWPKRFLTHWKELQIEEASAMD